MECKEGEVCLKMENVDLVGDGWGMVSGELETTGMLKELDEEPEQEEV